MYIIYLSKMGERFSIEVDGCEAAWHKFSAMCELFECDDFNIDLLDGSTGEVLASKDDE